MLHIASYLLISAACVLFALLLAAHAIVAVLAELPEHGESKIYILDS